MVCIGVRLPSNKTFFADVNIVGRRTNTGNVILTINTLHINLKLAYTMMLMVGLWSVQLQKLS